MPGGYHYSSTCSVSSLSVSSTSTFSSSSSASQVGLSNQSRQTALTSLSRMFRRQRSRERSQSYIDNERRLPSPLDSDSEDERGAPMNADTRRRVQHMYSDTSTSSSPTSFRDECPALPAYQQAAPSQPCPSDPYTFSQHFPSNQPLTIYHPPTIDGNLNLAVDARTPNGPLGLFHLRMHHLRERDFSLRRYSRANGRQVCESTSREKIKPAKRVSLKREAKKEAKRREKLRKLERQSQRVDPNPATAVGEGPGAVEVNTTKDAAGHTQGRTVVIHQDKDRQGPLPQIRASNPSSRSKALQRNDSGYSSAATSPTHSLQAAAEMRAGSPRDPGLDYLEGLEEEAEQAEGDPVDEYIESDLEYEDDEPVAEDYRLAKNKIKIEFSNYTHLEMVRKGVKASAKRYEFEYWGVRYFWKKVERVRRMSTSAATSALEALKRSPRRNTICATSNPPMVHAQQSVIEYHLFSQGRTKPVATIIPVELSPREIVTELEMGGWVPPCTLQIHNEQVVHAPNAGDVCDVIVATGLLALTDDCIERQWHRSEGFAAQFPKIVPALRTKLLLKWSKMNYSALNSRRLSTGNKRPATQCTVLESVRMEFSEHLTTEDQGMEE